MQESFSHLHAMAVAYAAANIPVFPCEAGGKRPVTKNGFHDSTTDIEQINSWWKENPEFNLAICPENAGLFVVDIDPGAPLSIRNELLPTYQVRTPRGGWHLYYEGSGRTSSNKLAEHVDTRGVGGYVLVPPSCVDGKHYAVDQDIDYAPVPEWVTSKLAAIDTPLKAAVDEKDLPGSIERATKLLKAYAGKGDFAIEGYGGDDRTFRLCCEMLDLGLSQETALDLIEDHWNPQCVPPWTTEELQLKLENAASYMQNEGGAYAVDDPAKIFGDIAKTISASQPENPSRFRFKDEAEQDGEPDPTWIIKDLVSERSTVMLYGTSGSYKSFLTLDIALSVATGSRCFGSDVKPGLVFYAALEGRSHLKKARKAWRALKATQGSIDNFYLGRAPMVAVDAEVQEFGDEIARVCAGRHPRLVIIDTTSKAMAGLNENDAQDANRFITFCDSLVEAFGCTVIAVHHASDKMEGRGARGSSAFQAGFDTVLEVKAHKETKAVAVYVRKHKDAEERQQPWTFEGRTTGPSLTFEATTMEQHRLLTGEAKVVTPKAVGGALKDLKAFGEPAGVTTAVLATQITPPCENESIEDRAAAIARTGRVLAVEAKRTLEAYCVRRGRDWIWHLQAPTA